MNNLIEYSIKSTLLQVLDGREHLATISEAKETLFTHEQGE